MAEVWGETANPTPQAEVVRRRIRLPDRHGRGLSERTGEWEKGALSDPDPPHCQRFWPQHFRVTERRVVVPGPDKTCALKRRSVSEIQDRFSKLPDGPTFSVMPKAKALVDRARSSSENSHRWPERMHGRESEHRARYFGPRQPR